MTKAEAYNLIGIPVGYHFLYLGVECLIDDKPSLICREHVIGDWRRPYYSKFQLPYILDNTEQVRTLSP